VERDSWKGEEYREERGVERAIEKSRGIGTLL
jgi:hypothetical protein